MYVTVYLCLLQTVLIVDQVVASLYAPPFYIFRTFTTVRQWTNYALIATGGAFIFLYDLTARFRSCSLSLSHIRIVCFVLGHVVTLRCAVVILHCHSSAVP